MSLLHNPEYTQYYDLDDDTSGLTHLRWSQFMCKCGRCSVDSGLKYMEKNVVLFLDGIAREERMRMDVEMGYVCKYSADKMSLPSKDGHRIGLAAKIRVLNPVKRMKIIRGLIYRGVSRIRVSDKSLYFDIDDLREQSFYIG